MNDQTVSSSTSSNAPVPFSTYQKKLFFFLSIATFFEGYDFYAITQVLPHLRVEMGLGKAAASYLLSLINFGTVLAYLVIGRADRFGRKRVLSATILGYATFSGLSAFAPNVWIFGLLQMGARIFLIGEWATSMVIVAEEYPAARRGLVLGIVGASAGLGSVVCAGIVPGLVKAFGWRSVYLIGVLPLLLMAYARRGMKETARFEALGSDVEGKATLRALWESPYRMRALKLGVIWLLVYVATQNAVSVWKDYAMTELRLPEAAAGRIMMIAGLSGMLLVFFAGKLIDVVGRRVGATIILSTTGLGVLGAYTASSFLPLLLSLSVCVFGVSAVLTVLNAFNTELFPTEYRGSALALSNNLIGRSAYVTSPMVVGWIAETGGWALPLRFTALCPFLALGLVWLWLPETKGRELEELSEISGS